MDQQLELGLDTFGDVTRTADGQPLPHAQVIRDVVAEAVLADAVGVDFIGLGEHHRADFAVSSPELVLAAIAGQTRRIRLGSAVTVLSSDDPVRVFQRFATLNAVSNGRAEVILGRGSFIESFPLFGYQLDQYEMLFEEKLALFAALLQADRTGEPVTWRGTTRAPLVAQRVFPPTEHGRLTTWIGVGGSPESVARKIAATAQALGLSRFDMKYSAGPLAHDLLLHSIELYGREVIPRVRALLGSPQSAQHAPTTRQAQAGSTHLMAS